MRASSMLAFALVAAAVSGGCKDKPNGSSAPIEKEVSTQGSPPPAAQPMSSDCDMSGMDMSKMSAEEHQKMMDNCVRQDPASP